MDKTIKESIELLARILLLYMHEGKVVPKDYMKLMLLADGKWDEV